MLSETLLLCVGAALLPPSDPPEEPWVPLHALTRDLTAEEAGALEAYGWDDRPLTPANLGAGPARLNFGELGLLPEAALYLTLNERGADGPADLSADARPVQARATEWVAGRFGAGLELGPESSLAVEPAAGGAALLDETWTIEFWMRPTAEPARGPWPPILTVPDALTLTLGPGGQLDLHLHGEPPARLRSKAALATDGWSHVALTYDGEEFPQFRVVVDGRPTQRMRPEGFEWRGGDRLVFGRPGDVAQGAQFQLDDVRVLRRSTQTSALIDRAAAGATVGEHTLRLVLAGGERTETLWAGVLDVDRLEGGGLGTASEWKAGWREHLAGTEAGLRWAEGNWEQVARDAPLLARTTHPTVYVGDHRVFVFGGETRDTHRGPMVNTNDTWLFDLRTHAWRRVTGGDPPPPTCHQSAAYSPKHDVVLYSGGFRLDSKPFVQHTGLWLFHVAEERWEQRAPTGDELGPVSGSVTVYHPELERFLIITGLDVLAYDPVGNHLRKLPRPQLVLERGRMPRHSDGYPGSSVMAEYDPLTRSIVMFGGENWIDGEHLFNGVTALYRPESGLIAVREPGESPSPRVRSGFAYDSLRQRFVLFGGVLGQHSLRMDDLWTYRVDVNRWQRVLSANTPTPRGGYYDMAFDPELDRFALLCGRNAPNRFLNDAWLLRLDPEARGRALYVFDRAGQPDAARLDLAWSQPGDSRVAFRFRGSSDLRSWTEFAATPGELPDGHRYLQVEIRAQRDPGADPPTVHELAFRSAGAPAPELAPGRERLQLELAPTE